MSYRALPQTPCQVVSRRLSTTCLRQAVLCTSFLPLRRSELRAHDERHPCSTTAGTARVSYILALTQEYQLVADISIMCRNNDIFTMQEDRTPERRQSYSQSTAAQLRTLSRSQVVDKQVTSQLVFGARFNELASVQWKYRGACWRQASQFELTTVRLLGMTLWC